MSSPLERLIQALQIDREILLDHPLYTELDSLSDFQQFIEYHVFEAWDFMSFLKALQVSLKEMNLHWIPSEDPIIARWIKEIALAKESEKDGERGYCGHFELYLMAMEMAGVSTQRIELLLEKLKSGEDFLNVVTDMGLPAFVRTFIKINFEIVSKGKPHEIAASFTLGRMGLIPELFRKMVDEGVKNHPEKLGKLAFYFDRNIHLDEQEHGPLACIMMNHLIENDPQKLVESEKAARETLQARKVLWDGIHQMIKKKNFELV